MTRRSNPFGPIICALIIVCACNGSPQFSTCAELPVDGLPFPPSHDVRASDEAHTRIMCGQGEAWLAVAEYHVQNGNIQGGLAVDRHGKQDYESPGDFFVTSETQTMEQAHTIRRQYDGDVDDGFVTPFLANVGAYNKAREAQVARERALRHKTAGDRVFESITISSFYGDKIRFDFGYTGARNRPQEVTGWIGAVNDRPVQKLGCGDLLVFQDVPRQAYSYRYHTLMTYDPPRGLASNADTGLLVRLHRARVKVRSMARQVFVEEYSKNGEVLGYVLCNADDTIPGGSYQTHSFDRAYVHQVGRVELPIAPRPDGHVADAPESGSSGAGRTQAAVALEIGPGDTVITLYQTPVKSGKKVLATVPRNTELSVTSVRDNWFGIILQQDGKQVPGWVYAKHVGVVRSPPPSPEYPIVLDIEQSNGLDDPPKLSYSRQQAEIVFGPGLAKEGWIDLLSEIGAMLRVVHCENNPRVTGRLTGTLGIMPIRAEIPIVLRNLEKGFYAVALMGTNKGELGNSQLSNWVVFEVN